MLVPVLSRDIQIGSLRDSLREYGLVVIETSRTHARDLAEQTINALEIDRESIDDPQLIHLSTEVADRGWSDFFIYTSVYNYVPNETQEIVVKAVLNWVEENSPDTYIANV